MFYVTAFGFVGCILFVFRICAILDWLQRRACKIQSVWGASVILVPHRFMGGIFPDCRDVHVSKPGWPHDLLLLGISWQDPNAEDGQQGEPVGNALYFLFGHLSTVARLLALPGVLFFDDVLMLSHTVDAESHSLRLPQGSTMRTVSKVESGASVAATSITVVVVFGFLAWYYRYGFKELCHKIKDLPEHGITALNLDRQSDGPMTV